MQRGALLFLLATAPAALHAFAPSARPVIVARSQPLQIRALKSASDDPFNTPRGPPPGEQMPRPAGGIPQDALSGGGTSAEEDPELILGARVFGGIVGGVSSNVLYSGISSAFGDCSPFNLAACSDRSFSSAMSAPSSSPAPSSAGGSDAYDGLLADILRNPTSILPKDWNLPGRKYLDDLTPSAPAPEPSAAPQAPLPTPQPAMPEVPVPSLSVPAVPVQPPPLELPAAATPTTIPTLPPAAPSAEQLKQLQEELVQLQQEIAEKQSAILPTSYEHAPTTTMGIVPPASAAEVSDALAPSLHPADWTAAAAAAASHSSSLLVHDAGFMAIAEKAGGIDPGGIIATGLGIVLGAVTMEFVATNKEAPIPDPLLGGLWSSLHAVARFGSSITGKAASAVKGALPL